MEFDCYNIRPVVEDRLSSLPDELIHKILYCFDMKFAVQTCLLSSRWKLLWTSMPLLNFISAQYDSLSVFTNFVTKVLSHRNRQVGVSSVKILFSGAASQDFVRMIANYAFSHNVQQLTVSSNPKAEFTAYPPYLLSSHSLKHLTLFGYYSSLRTPLDFPALTTLHVSHICLRGDKTRKSLDLFSKCVNLKNLNLEHFYLHAVGVFDIITPQLSNLVLIKGDNVKVINLIAPQLENLTIIDCEIEYLNAPPGLSSLSYRDYYPMSLSEYGFCNLNKATICLSMYNPSIPYKKEDAHETINMLQELHSARNLTLNMDIIECISSYPDLLLHHPSPFRNLICLTLNSRMIDGYRVRKDAYKLKMSTEVGNFFLENSPNCRLTIDIVPEVLLSK